MYIRLMISSCIQGNKEAPVPAAAARQQNDQNHAGLTQRTIRLVLCVYILSNYNKDLTSSLALSLQRKRKRGELVPLDVVGLGHLGRSGLVVVAASTGVGFWP